MKRAAIYARYSTDLQNEQSVEDQIEHCLTFARKQGFQVVETFSDRARSGATMFGRPGLLEMMRGAEERGFDVIIAEALDRISRSQADLPDIYRRLEFQNVKLIGVNDGGQPADTVQIGLRGLVGELYRQDGAQKIRRGMTGVARQGRYPGGKAYGYEPVSGKPGERQILEHEAGIVHWIFDQYLSGSTPRQIAHDLNEQGVRPPRGRAWNASTINGSHQRSNGIIQNTAYVGRVAWNRVRMIQDPRTGNRVSRPNPREDWLIQDGQHPAIVTEDVFARANALKDGKRKGHPSLARKPKRLLTGLLKCGCCGGGMSTAGKDKSGRDRVRCSRHKESRTCPDPRTHYLDTIEATVLDMLRRELQHPDHIEAFLQTYQQERRRLAADAINERTRLERKILDIGMKLDRMTALLVQGIGDAVCIDRASKEARTEEAKLQAQLDALNASSVGTVELHPAAMKCYLQSVEELHGLVERNMSGGDGETARVLRELVERVVVHPPKLGKEPTVEVKGRLAALTGLPDVLLRRKSGGSAVAEEGLEPPTRGL